MKKQDKNGKGEINNMTKITLEQYECPECKRKWYINTDDKKGNELDCPYGCEVKGPITRQFNMVIKNYQEYEMAQPEGSEEPSKENTEDESDKD